MASISLGDNLWRRVKQKALNDNVRLKDVADAIFELWVSGKIKAIVPKRSV